MKYVVIDTETGEVLAKADGLPVAVNFADGGRAEFSFVGQSEPAKTQRYKLLDVVETSRPPEYPHSIVSETGRAANGLYEVGRAYAPDQSAYEAAIEDHIDSIAKSRGYSSGVSLSRYGFSTIPQWKAEADAFNAWLDAVWSFSIASLADVVEGREQPPALDKFIASLPVIRWP